jgi:flagellar hook-associated protein 1 FlgK
VTSTTGLPLAASPDGRHHPHLRCRLNLRRDGRHRAATPAYNVAFTEGGGKTFSLQRLDLLQIAGTPNAGDTFVISAQRAGVSDNRNALLLAPCRRQARWPAAPPATSRPTPRSSADVGNKTREVEVTAAAQESMLRQAEDAQQSPPG